MPTVHVTHYTDPNCPFAYSAEPQRRRLQWRYGAQLSWTTRMVGLADRRETYEEKGMTPEKLAHGYARLAEQYGMPFDTEPRSAVPATLPACLEVVAVREHAGEALAQRLLRELRLQQMAYGNVLDELHTLREASHAAGIDSAQLDEWAKDPRTDVALREDYRVARAPHPIAVSQLAHKLGSWEGGQRYSTPTYVLGDDEGNVAVAAGFVPADVYDHVFANFAPELEVADAAGSAAQVLEWAAGEPLATAEIAAVMGASLDEARSSLAQAGATEQPIGTDALWVA